MPTVSIVMPVHNGARFLQQAIDSVRGQQLADWELIVVNDGSTDATADILAQQIDPRIKVILQDNGGEASARNRGLDEARGEYIAFLDADDLYLPAALLATTSFLDAQPHLDSVYTDGYFCNGHETIIGRLSDIRPGPFTGSILEPLVLDPAVIGGVCCVLTRRRAIESAPARFDPGLVIGPDWDFWIQLARAATFGYLHTPTCMYRIHDTNISVTARAERRRADLIKGRRKVMEASWFSQLSVTTRLRFFYGLLLELLQDRVDEQREILETVAFRQLPLDRQAQLMRYLGSHYALAGREQEFALMCLERAARDDGSSPSSSILLGLYRTCPLLARIALRARRLSVSVRRKKSVRSTPGDAALAILRGDNRRD